MLKYVLKYVGLPVKLVLSDFNVTHVVSHNDIIFRLLLNILCMMSVIEKSG